MLGIWCLHYLSSTDASISKGGGVRPRPQSGMRGFRLPACLGVDYSVERRLSCDGCVVAGEAAHTSNSLDGHCFPCIFFVSSPA